MALLEAERLKRLNDLLLIRRKDERVETCDFHYDFPL